MKILDKINISNVSETISGISSKLEKTFANESTPSRKVHRVSRKQNLPVEPSVESIEKIKDDEQEIVIDSLSSMSSLLNSIKPKSSPAVVQALQCQLQILNFVQSPTMSGMVIDNMIMSLYKSLQMASEQEKQGLRDAFSSMIQSFVFFSEAQLRYEDANDQQEALKLLDNAGQFLSDSVMTVTNLATGGLTGAANYVVKNVFGSDQKKSSVSFLAQLASMIGKKKQIQQKY